MLEWLLSCNVRLVLGPGHPGQALHCVHPRRRAGCPSKEEPVEAALGYRDGIQGVWW